MALFRLRSNPDRESFEESIKPEQSSNDWPSLPALLSLTRRR